MPSMQVSQEEFVPARMPVHCVCEVPYNPDRFMVQCTACLDCEWQGRQRSRGEGWGVGEGGFQSVQY